MGGKRRYSAHLLQILEVERRDIDRVVLVDAGPWGWVWRAIFAWPETTAMVLDSWDANLANEPPRELWTRLSQIPLPPPDERAGEHAAQWLWLQARSASGVPVWFGPDLDRTWETWRGGYKDETEQGMFQKGGAHAERFESQPKERDAPSAAAQARGFRMGASPDRSSATEQPAAQAGRWMAENGRGEPQAVGQKGDWLAEDGRGTPRAIGQAGDSHPEWRQAAGGEDAREDLKAHQRGDWERARSGRGNRREKTADADYDPRWPHGGIVRPSTIADRIRGIWSARNRWGGELEIVHGDVRAIAPERAAVLFDPPYVGATGYGWRCPREDVVAIARAWADAGARIAVCEAEPLPIDGFEHSDLSIEGKKPEWVTHFGCRAVQPAKQENLWAAT